MPFEVEDRKRAKRTEKKVDRILDLLGPDPEIPIPPDPPDVDPNVYVFDTDDLPAPWSHTPIDNSDAYLIQSGPERADDLINLWIPKVPQLEVASYSLKLWLEGTPQNKRNVLWWWVNGTGVPGDNDKKFGSGVWVDKGTRSFVRFKQGFGVGEQEQANSEAPALWKDGEFSMEHLVDLQHRKNMIASPVGAVLRAGDDPIGDCTVRRIHIDLGDRNGECPVGATYTRARIEITFA